MKLLEHLAAAAVGAIVALLAVIVLLLPAAPAAATVIAASSHTSLWWDSDTCRAFAAWEHKHTPRRLMSLVRDSEHADTYLKADVGQLYEAVRHGQAAHTEAAWVLADCTTTGD